MLNGVGRLSSVSTTNVCRRDGDVEYSNCERYKSQEDMMRMKWACCRENIIVVNDPFREK